jgi:YesN/AraC family two-component response regulator
MRLDDATILIVDDEPILLEVCSVWLKKSGFQRIFTAADGVEALVLIGERKVDVLITDIHMPKMGGVQLIEAIRERGYSVPSIFFMSAYMDLEPREMHRLGVKRFLDKPFDAGILVEAVTTSLGESIEFYGK